MRMTGQLKPVQTLKGLAAAEEALNGAVNGTFDPYSFEGHINNRNNPHEVTATQLGLGNVDNTADVDKPISTATQAALDLKADNTDLSDTNLRIVEVNKSLSDYQNAISSININQSPKQTASGYGTVSLPANAANGQISCVVGGVSATNLIKNGDFSNGITGWASYADASIVASNNSLIITGTGNSPYSYAIHNNAGDNVLGRKIYVRYKIKVTNSLCVSTFCYIVGSSGGQIVASQIISSPVQNSIYTVSGVTALSSTVTGSKFHIKPILVYPDATTANGKSAEIQEVVTVDLTATFGAGNEPTETQCNAMFPTWFNGTNSTISAGRLVSENEDETETTYQYYPDVGVLRSVGDVRDEIVGGEHIKRIDDDGETVLAEPIVTPIDVTGTLVGHPNGTIYWEPVLPVAGIYTASGIEVTDTDFPIDTLDRIVKIDFDTGLEITIDKSTAEIAADGLSFTHPDLAEGDIVFFTYYHAVTGTAPKLDVEYYDSRYTVEDSVLSGTFYKWKVTVENGTPSLSVEVVS